MDTIDFLNKIGPFLSGIGLIFTAVAAWTTFLLINRQALNRVWLDSFRQLYNEFWKDEQIAIMRNIIVSDVEYKKVEQVILERLKNERNLFSFEENKIIECVDRFCAFLMKVDFFDREYMTPKQRELCNKTYGNYWVRKVKDREALYRYKSKFWPTLII